MKLLLDTHALLWFHQRHPSISSSVRDAIANSDNECFVSIASLWEIAIKISLGKLRLPLSLDEFIQRNILDAGFSLLNIEVRHLLAVADLPRHHGDPFDRLLIVQSLCDSLTLVSCETQFDKYGITRLW